MTSLDVMKFITTSFILLNKFLSTPLFVILNSSIHFVENRVNKNTLGASGCSATGRAFRGSVTLGVLVLVVSLPSTGSGPETTATAVAGLRHHSMPLRKNHEGTGLFPTK